MVQCKKCEKPMLVEDLGDGQKRVKCLTCGVNEVLDAQGRQLLTSDAPYQGAHLLLG